MFQVIGAAIALVTVGAIGGLGLVGVTLAVAAIGVRYA